MFCKNSPVKLQGSSNSVCVYEKVFTYKLNFFNLGLFGLSVSS